ncbi:origin recognition complex subunit 3 N-terminus-domain-containing protein [Russula aff. rugulosa BPL654]|nr:origin recognition complex subunit 3 N-terminus-domain-containing protein [Russula aff. rugulosa BPL654]
MSFPLEEDVDATQPVIYIPCDETSIGSDIGDDTDQFLAEGYSPFDERDLPGGYVARFNLYRAAWQKCLGRIEDIINSLQTPVVDEIVRSVHRAYNDVLPGLPYAELPVVAISGSSMSQGFIADVANRLEANPVEESEDEDPPPSSYITHLYPSDCSNIMSTMKSLVTGFVERPPAGQDVKRKPVTSLSNYDIELLKVWHGVLRDAAEGEPPPQLVVFLHEFEQFDEAVVQDLFYICSSYVPQLPLIFVLALSSPHNSFLNAVYPQSMLSLLRVDTFTVPSGTGFIEELVTKTFFDLDFEPDIMVGPATLDFLTDFFCRNSASVEGVLLILQLAHLKHFDEPLTTFVRDEQLDTSSAELASKKLSDPKATPFLASLFSWSFGPQELASNEDGWPVHDIASLLTSIAEARTDFRFRLCRLKLAYGMMRKVHEAMLHLGYRGIGIEMTPLEMMSASLKGGLLREGKYLGTMTRKLSDEKLSVLLRELRSYLDELPDNLDEVQKVQQRVTTTALLLEDDREGDESSQIADEFGNWLIDYFQEHIINLEDLRLWEIWHTGSTPFPSEMLNPAPRATIVSALLQPHTFLPLATSRDSNDSPMTQRRQRLPIWKLPDTSILFRRYLEAGRMINVYDWYESFSQSSGSATADDDGHGGGERNGHVDEEDDEEWKMHVQARFMRALHTLDFVGLVKHTGRKAEHVMRTAYDVAE